jgi:hypothetical protein
MALSIDFSSANNKSSDTWYVGKRIDYRYHAEDASINITLQADGDELEYIKRKFNNISTVNGAHVVRWYGDHARFIIGNILVFEDE